MNGLSDRINCKCIKSADVPQLTQLYAILETALKIRATLTNWTNTHAHKYIEKNLLDTNATESLG